MARAAAPRMGKTGRKRIFNLLPSKDQDRDWSVETAVAAGALRRVRLPPEVDLRAAWWKIADQGRTGSCVGWATADGVMRYLLVQAGRLKRSEMISPRFIWMASKETDTFTQRPESFIEEAGTTLKAAADICRKYGTALEADLPFTVPANMYLGRSDVFYARCATRKAAGYFNARRNVTEWKRALSAGTPILAGLNVDSNFDAGGKAGRLDAHNAKNILGGHAVAIVGYRADGRFIIRNSWGTTWGDKGFAYASADYVQAAFFEESYVMTV